MTKARSFRLAAALERDWWIGTALTLIAAGLYGLIASWWTPRGPVSTAPALVTVVISLAVGAFAGVVMRTRWAMLLATVTFAVTFELGRIGAVGATIDGIHLGSLYGIIAFALGRGLQGVLALLPMLLGVALGVAASRRLEGAEPVRRGWSTAGLWGRRTVTALITVGLVALSVAIIRPVHTAPYSTPTERPSQVASRNSLASRSAVTAWPSRSAVTA